MYSIKINTLPKLQKYLDKIDLNDTSTRSIQYSQQEITDLWNYLEDWDGDVRGNIVSYKITDRYSYIGVLVLYNIRTNVLALPIGEPMGYSNAVFEGFSTNYTSYIEIDESLSEIRFIDI